METNAPKQARLFLDSLRTESQIYIYEIEPFTQSIISRLKHKKAFSCKKIAALLRVSPRTIYHYQEGTRPISIKNLYTLQNLLYDGPTNLSFLKNDYLLLASGSGNRKRISKIPLTINCNLLYLAGYLFGDGCLYSKNWTISFVDEYSTQIEKIKYLVENIFLVNTKLIQSKGKCELRIYSKTIQLFFNSIFGMPIGAKKNKMHIPKILEGASKEDQLEFIRGLFDADGGTLRIEEYRIIPKWFLNSPNIEFVQTDKKFVLEVKDLCVNLDLPVVGPYFNPANGGYRLFLNGKKALQKCNSLTLFKHTVKQKRLSSICRYFEA